MTRIAGVSLLIGLVALLTTLPSGIGEGVVREIPTTAMSGLLWLATADSDAINAAASRMLGAILLDVGATILGVGGLWLIVRYVAAARASGRPLGDARQAGTRKP